MTLARCDETVSGAKTVPGDRTTLRYAHAEGQGEGPRGEHGCGGHDGADSKGKANDKEVCGDAAPVN